MPWRREPFLEIVNEVLLKIRLVAILSIAREFERAR
jgi:hypothetical protein